MEPLPPVKEVEYRCIVGKFFDELSGQESVTFAFETAKEFSSFRYEIAVRYKVTHGTMGLPGTLEFRVLGMTATRTMMPAFGTARSVLRLPNLPLGVYNVRLIKSDGTENMFCIELTKRGFQILQPIPRKRFIDLVIDSKAVLQGARIASTVTRTPAPPLVPRTIQKRQPNPPTAEELLMLASLQSETPEERDAREERELFGEGRASRKPAPVLEPVLASMTTPVAKAPKAEAKSAKHSDAPKKAEHAIEPKATAKSAKAEPKASPAKPTPAKPAAKASAKSAPASKPAASKTDQKSVKAALAKAREAKANSAKAATAKAATKSAPAKPSAKSIVKPGSAKVAGKPAGKAVAKSSAKPAGKKLVAAASKGSGKKK